VSAGDALDGEDVVSGFSCPLAPLFAMRQAHQAR
jgi:hypothetical protein